MKKKIQYIVGIIFLMLCLLTGCEGQSVSTEDSTSIQSQQSEEPSELQLSVEESGEYTSKDEVAAYLYEFGHLPDNFITKKEAKALG